MTRATVRRGEDGAGAGVPASGPLWSRTVEIDDAEAAAVVGGGDLCWLAPSREIAGWGVALRIPVADVRRHEEAADVIAEHLSTIVDDNGSTAASPARSTHRGTPSPALPGARPVAFASLTFDAAASGSVAVVPRTTVHRRNGRAWVTTVSDRPITGSDVRLPQPPPAPRATGRVRYAGTTAAEIAWIEAVDGAVRRIRAGDLEKVVLARDRVVYSDEPFDLPRVLARLHARFPSCYTFRVEGLVGASPELLIRREGAAVASLVLAGTAPRGGNADEDRRIGAQLQRSTKDLAEHRPAVDSVRATLGPLASELDVEPRPHLLRLANVQHLATDVTGRLRTLADAVSLATRLHPTAAVGGMPTDRALAVIAELETIDRGRYAGPVGWVDADGDGEFAIALRCAQFDDTTASARLFAGAGIVADSLPESELEETRLKLRAMQSAL